MKTKKKILSVVLVVVMLFTVTAAPTFALDTTAFKTTIKNSFVRLLGNFVETAIKIVNVGFRENDNFLSESEYTYDNFYEGTQDFIDSAADGASWSMGYGSASLVPENWEEYNLYLGGFMSEQNGFVNSVKEILDDMKVRVIALNDGSQRGTTVFATIDSIGVSNADIRYIRQQLSAFANENNLNSINIFSTHCHSCIDTQGLWTDILKKWPKNIFASTTGIGKVEQGADAEYMEFFFEKVQQAIKEAVTSMHDGSMSYARMDIGKEYFVNKNRDSASALDSELKRLIFTPYDTTINPTVILNMAAHPDVVGLATDSDPVKGHGVSGDYVYYIGEVLNGAGYDFMFFNGAICGIYESGLPINNDSRLDRAASYGREIGKMVLGMTMTEEEIKNDDYLMSLNFPEEKTQNSGYVPWYEGWTPTTQTEVEPILNIKIEPVEIQISNPIMTLAGKCNFANYKVKVTSEKKYFVTSEIGYIEMGKEIKIAMVPGELCADLAFGGTSLTAQGSVTGKDFTGKTLAEIFGDDIIVFGLANDAIGYIVPDNDYAMAIDFGHYQESISLGKNTASTIMAGFENLADEIK